MKDNHHRLHDKPQFWKRNFEKNTIVCVCVCVCGLLQMIFDEKIYYGTARPDEIDRGFF